MGDNPVIVLPVVEVHRDEPHQEQGLTIRMEAKSQLAEINHDPGQLTEARAQLLVNSGILPKTINTPEKAIAIALNGRDLGISATVAFNNIWILDGKPSLSAALVTALANRANLRFQWLRDKTDVIGNQYDAQGNITGQGVVDWAWEVEMLEVWQGGLLRHKMSLLWTECVAAGWTTKDPWKKHPRAMARARLIVQVIKAHRPDVLMGMQSFEDLADGSGNEHYRYNPATNETELLNK